MKLSIEFLEEQSACSEGIEWFKNQKETDSIEVLKKLINENQLLWANWLIVRTMDYKQYVSYAIFAAEQVIDIYEKKYPNDKRPRKAIEAAKACLKNPSDKNKKAAYAAAYAAASAAASDAASDAAAAAYAAASAAADAAAAYATYAAAYAAAADAAASAAADASREMYLKILNYGLKLLEAAYMEIKQVTPIPGIEIEEDGGTYCALCGASSYEWYESQENNRDFIVGSINNFNRMLAALKEVHWLTQGPSMEKQDAVMMQVLEAIREAEKRATLPEEK